MTKEIIKTKMTRSRLREKQLKQKEADSKFAFNKQKKLLYKSPLQCRTINSYFVKTGITSIIYTYYQLIYTYFKSIDVVDSDIILSNDQVITDTFDNCISNTLQNLLTQ